jgi:hypothetical protein
MGHRPLRTPRLSERLLAQASERQMCDRCRHHSRFERELPSRFVLSSCPPFSLISAHHTNNHCLTPSHHNWSEDFRLSVEDSHEDNAPANASAEILRATTTGPSIRCGGGWHIPRTEDFWWPIRRILLSGAQRDETGARRIAQASHQFLLYSIACRGTARSYSQLTVDRTDMTIDREYTNRQILSDLCAGQPCCKQAQYFDLTLCQLS